jgi:hypothetical protein
MGLKIPMLTRLDFVDNFTKLANSELLKADLVSSSACSILKISFANNNFVLLFLLCQVIWLNDQYRQKAGVAKSSKNSRSAVRLPHKPRQLIRLLMDPRLTLQIYCFNDKSSTGSDWEKLKRRQQAEIHVGVPEVEESDDGGSTSSGGSRKPRGARGNRGGRRGNHQSPAANAAAAVAAAAAAAASQVLNERNPRRDAEFRRANDLEPEKKCDFKLEGWAGPLKEHKRIVSFSVLHLAGCFGYVCRVMPITFTRMIRLPRCWKSHIRVTA